MPVPDPTTGSDRWSIDFLLADQDAIPTFVEVKRFRDTRSRREVVGQMLEYAANGHYYWSKTELRDHAEATSQIQRVDLEAAIQTVIAHPEASVDTYFQRLEDNLREGQVRLIFLLEESSWELRSLVDFLNRQMERSEVLLVEMQMFERDGRCFAVPTLFGFSEEARRTKRIIEVSSSAERKTSKWDEATFFTALDEESDAATAIAIRKIYEHALQGPFEVRWGKGARTGTLSIAFPAICRPAFLRFDTSGNFGPNFGWLKGDATPFRDRLKLLLETELNLEFDGDYADKWPNFPADRWRTKADALISICSKLSDEFGTPQKLS